LCGVPDSAVVQIANVCHEALEPLWQPEIIPVLLDQSAGPYIVVIRVEPARAPSSRARAAWSRSPSGKLTISIANRSRSPASPCSVVIACNGVRSAGPPALAWWVVHCAVLPPCRARHPSRPGQGAIVLPLPRVAALE
jgi:hypothetical protein